MEDKVRRRGPRAYHVEVTRERALEADETSERDIDPPHYVIGFCVELTLDISAAEPDAIGGNLQAGNVERPDR